MINLDTIANKNNKEHNEKWSCTPYHLYRIFIIGGSGSGKANVLPNLINEQNNDINDINDIQKLFVCKKIQTNQCMNI